MQRQNSKALCSNSYKNNATKYVMLSSNEQTKPTFSELNCVNSGELKVVPRF